MGRIAFTIFIRWSSHLLKLYFFRQSDALRIDESEDGSSNAVVPEMSTTRPSCDDANNVDMQSSSSSLVRAKTRRRRRAQRTKLWIEGLV